jgi:hypothetical protein
MPLFWQLLYALCVLTFTLGLSEGFLGRGQPLLLEGIVGENKFLRLSSKKSAIRGRKYALKMSIATRAKYEHVQEQSYLPGQGNTW